MLNLNINKMKTILAILLILSLFSCSTNKETNTSKLNEIQKEWLINQDQSGKIADKINSLGEDKFNEFCALLNYRIKLSIDISHAAKKTNEELGYEAVKMTY